MIEPCYSVLYKRYILQIYIEQFKDTIVTFKGAADIIYKSTSRFEKALVLCVVQKIYSVNLHTKISEPTVTLERAKVITYKYACRLRDPRSLCCTKDLLDTKAKLASHFANSFNKLSVLDL